MFPTSMPAANSPALGDGGVSGFVLEPRFDVLGGYNSRAYAYSRQVKGRIVAAPVDSAKDKAQYTCSEGSCVLFSIKTRFIAATVLVTQW